MGLLLLDPNLPQHPGHFESLVLERIVAAQGTTMATGPPPRSQAEGAAGAGAQSSGLCNRGVVRGPLRDRKPKAQREREHSPVDCAIGG